MKLFHCCIEKIDKFHSSTAPVNNISWDRTRYNSDRLPVSLWKQAIIDAIKTNYSSKAKKNNIEVT